MTSLTSAPEDPLPIDRPRIRPLSGGIIGWLRTNLFASITSSIAAGPAAADFPGLMSATSCHRSTSAMRALYQFMNRLMPRLMVRNTSMMSAIASIACPVWFSVVLAMLTRSG